MIVQIFIDTPIPSQESLPPSRRNSSTSATLSQAYNYLQPLQLFRFASLTNLEQKQHKDLQQIGLAYFIYLFLYSGMEFTLTFLTHIRFGFTPMQQVGETVERFSNVELFSCRAGCFYLLVLLWLFCKVDL